MRIGSRTISVQACFGSCVVFYLVLWLSRNPLYAVTAKDFFFSGTHLHHSESVTSWDFDLLHDRLPEELSLGLYGASGIDIALDVSSVKLKQLWHEKTSSNNPNIIYAWNPSIHPIRSLSKETVVEKASYLVCFRVTNHNQCREISPDLPPNYEEFTGFAVLDSRFQQVGSTQILDWRTTKAWGDSSDHRISPFDCRLFAGPESELVHIILGISVEVHFWLLDFADLMLRSCC
jgi:hypothetical protein